MASSGVLTKIDVAGLKKINSGKVREIFELSESELLFVATDRISAYDVVMENGIPSKGALLTQLSAFWFSHLAAHYPELKTHLSGAPFPSAIPASLAPRTMIVKRTPLIKLESIVRGYITGSAWAEYKKSSTVHGMKMPEGLLESQKFPKPIWTPSTKAEQGEHDQNISKDQAVEIVGDADVVRRVEEASLKVYELAHAHALSLGIVIADTKLEFGLDPVTNDLVLVDEVLTPDSSRFWPADKYAVGKGQDSYDKQYLRDWLTSSGLKGKEGVAMPQEVVRETRTKYIEAYERLSGEVWQEN